ncbi:helix-turn-helix transcriptional regulator [Haloterrigena salifodinae]|uniref:helix-turn-helix transcriptional regulator n=1 Tax=Haloterrigena salifodinae TaxID=2675099 RepID=UPI000F86E29B|nr:transcriptional regulator [Haloterrigena salifodinae]
MNSTHGETDAEPVDVVNFLTQSPIRVAILQRLRETDRLTKAELREEADASRVTVQRNLNALEERELIRCRVREYEIRPLGEVVAEELESTTETMAFVERIRPFCRWFPDDELEFDVCALADATVVVSDSTDPYAPVNRHIEAMERADRFRCLLPAIGLPALTVARERVVEHDQSQEVVHSATLESTLRSEPEYRELVAEIRAHEACTMRVADRKLTYYLGLFDDVVQIGVEDDDGIPRALVETDASEIRAWAEETYECHLEQSEPLSL